MHARSPIMIYVVRFSCFNCWQGDPNPLKMGEWATKGMGKRPSSKFRDDNDNRWIRLAPVSND